MGSGCSNKSALDIQHPEVEEILRSRSIKLKDEQLRIRRTLIFNTAVSEESFLSLSTPRSGVAIKWKRGELIGKGAFAEVYQCMNLKSGELMALKHFTLTDEPKKIEKVYLNMTKEVSLLRLLSHNNIIKYFQSDLSPDMKSIDVLLEYVPGGSLRNILEKYGNLELSVIRNYSWQLLQGLKYLHDHKIVHRDLKSGNILISSDGVLKVGDFGSSKQFADFDKGLTRSIKGSPYWMAPEVIRKDGHGVKADIWSFGCVLIEMVSGRPPWSNYTCEPQKILSLIAKDNSYPDIPQTCTMLQDVIKRCLKRDPSLRPTCEDLLMMDFFNMEVELL